MQGLFAISRSHSQRYLVSVHRVVSLLYKVQIQGAMLHCAERSRSKLVEVRVKNPNRIILRYLRIWILSNPEFSEDFIDELYLVLVYKVGFLVQNVRGRGVVLSAAEVHSWC